MEKFPPVSPFDLCSPWFLSVAMCELTLSCVLLAFSSKSKTVIMGLLLPMDFGLSTLYSIYITI